MKSERWDGGWGMKGGNKKTSLLQDIINQLKHITEAF